MVFDKRTESELSIYAINGAIKESFKLEENRIDINMGNYLPGIYLIQFKTKNQLITQKIIKQ
ncbi:MAG: T9SS type A sorting domain-containing protein [Saprospiraceae bacterium]|nr:T9SS type A sorting domain-containing protein [Saprospiraceae bacterium]